MKVAATCWRILLTGLVGLAAWIVYPQYWAQNLFDRLPAEEGARRAIALDPDNWTYHFQLGVQARHADSIAQRRLAAEHLSEAAHLNPFNWETWIELAQAAELSGKTREAEQAYLRATRLNPRSAAYHWLTARFYLRCHRVTEAAEFFRAAVTLEPSYRAQWIDLLQESGVRDDIIEAAWPSDRDSKLTLLRMFLSDSASSDGAGRTALLERQWETCLLSGRFPTLGEGAFYVNHLFDAQEYDRARVEWLRLIEGNIRGKKDYFDGAEMIWNGDFEEEFSGSRFDWQVGASKHYSIVRSHGAGLEGSVGAKIRFTARGNLNFDGLRQPLLVEPGRWYELGLWVQSREISSRQGVFFQCVSLPDRRVLLQTGSITGSHDWRRMAGLFRVPENTRIIALEVRRKESRGADDPITGVLVLDNVSVRRSEP